MNFVSLEEKGKKIFVQFPGIRRFFKRIYQLGMYAISDEKIKVEGDVVRISPQDGYEYFFGYYDKSPWDATDRYVIALKVKNAHKVPDSTEEAEVIVLDTQKKNRVEKIGTTHCWNTQQACMAQWLGPDFKTRIIYNDCRNNKYVSVIYNFIDKKEEKVLDMPIYDVAKDGSFALTLDFSRLHRLRKGYGYANIKEKTKKEMCPDKACIWKINLKTGKINEVLKYTDLNAFEHRTEMSNAEHKVNHIMISPNGKRFMVLHRWFQNNKKFTRLITVNVDGSDIYNLSDDNFVSHCCWKNDEEILSFLCKKETGNHYYLMKDKTQEYKIYWPELNTDGHCTYSPDGKYIITDTYPNRKRLASVYLCTETDSKPKKIARVFAPFKYDNDVRCDLHPRWNHGSNKICIDSVHEGKKELYIINLPLNCEIKDSKEKIPRIIHSVWIGKSKKSKIVEQSIDSWNTFLPDYTKIEWTEDNFDIENACQYVKDAYKAKKWAFVSDYIRLKCLYEYGGIYLDTDMEVLKNINNFLEDDGFLCAESHHTICTAIIAAKPQAIWVKELLNQYESMSFFNSDGTYNCIPNTKIFQKYLEQKFEYHWSNEIQRYNDILVVYPSEYFSPLNCFNGKLNETENTYTIHHYDNTWKSSKEKLKRKILQRITRICGEELRYRIVNFRRKT